MPLALSTTNLRLRPPPAPKEGGGGRAAAAGQAGAVTRQQEQPAGRTNLPHAESSLLLPAWLGGGDGRARGGTAAGLPLRGPASPRAAAGEGCGRAGAPERLGLIAPAGHRPGRRRGELLGYPEKRVCGTSRPGGGSPQTRGRRGPLEPPPGRSPEPRKWLGGKEGPCRAAPVSGLETACSVFPS